jgi:hypothetical protein
MRYIPGVPEIAEGPAVGGFRVIWHRIPPGIHNEQRLWNITDEASTFGCVVEHIGDPGRTAPLDPNFELLKQILLN